jgi:hypothetical protein
VRKIVLTLLTLALGFGAALAGAAPASAAPQSCQTYAHRNIANHQVRMWVKSNRVNHGKVYSFRLYKSDRTATTFIPTYQDHGPKYVLNADRIHTVYGWQNGFRCKPWYLSY